MKLEELIREQRLILNAYVEIRNTAERLGSYLEELLPPKFEIGQRVMVIGPLSGRCGNLQVYHRLLTEGGNWFYQMRSETGTHKAGEWEDHIIAVSEEQQ